MGNIVTSLATTESNISFEVNPSQITTDKQEGSTSPEAETGPEKVATQRQKNKELLLKKTEEILNAIIADKSLEAMPREIRAIAGFTGIYAKTFASDRLIPLIGGFIMLRLFNPPLVTPEAFGLVPANPPLSRVCRRNLTLITKVLQNLSNGILFGNKEEYMSDLNPWLEENFGRMKEFLLQVATDPVAVEGREPWEDCYDPPRKEFDFGHLDSKDVKFIHRILFTYKDKLVANFAAESGKFNQETIDKGHRLFELLEELGEPEQSVVKYTPKIPPSDCKSYFPVI